MDSCVLYILAMRAKECNLSLEICVTVIAFTIVCDSSSPPKPNRKQT